MNINHLKELEKFAMPPTITVTTQQDFPYSGYMEVNDTIVGTGYAFELLNIIANYFNFTYTIKIANDTDDNSIQTILNQIMKKEVDVAVAFLPILSELKGNSAYGTILDEMEVTFFMKRPPESATGSGLLAPFDATVWILILITVLFVGPTIYLLIHLRSHFSKCGEKYSLSACMWFVYGALLKQGSTMSPVSSSIRLLFATWWIFIIILTAFYTANLTAFLTLSQFTLPITNVETLLKKHIKWFTFKGKTLDFMMKNNYSMVQELTTSLQKGYGSIISDSNEFLNYDVISMMHENAVFVTETLYAKLNLYEHYKTKMNLDLKEEQRCEYVIVPGQVYKLNRAFAFAEKSVLYRQFNIILSKLIEGGLVKYIKSKDLPEATICPLDLGSKERNLRLADLKMTYNVVFGGVILAAGIFFGELIYRQNLKNNSVGEQKKKPIKTARQNWIKSYDNIKNRNNNNNNNNNNNDNVKNNNISNDYVRTIRLSPSLKSLYERHLKMENTDRISKINGREYYVVKQEGKGYRLIPIGTPSAVMYQNYK